MDCPTQTIVNGLNDRTNTGNSTDRIELNRADFYKIRSNNVYNLTAPLRGQTEKKLY